ncbi:MAG: hypothetical protein ACE5OZ_17940 [Candidatus Heimdallarchaeota archaeon]
MSFFRKLFRKKEPKEPTGRDDATVEGRDDATVEGRDDATVEGSEEE